MLCLVLHFLFLIQICYVASSKCLIVIRPLKFAVMNFKQMLRVWVNGFDLFMVTLNNLGPPNSCALTACTQSQILRLWLSEVFRTSAKTH